MSLFAVVVFVLGLGASVEEQIQTFDLIQASTVSSSGVLLAVGICIVAVWVMTVGDGGGG